MYFRRALVIWIALSFFFQNSSNVEGSYHIQRKHYTEGSSKGSSPFVSPAHSPGPSPSNATTMPPHQCPRPAKTSSSSCIFDVTSFGAVGDGSTNDTAAFRKAWQAACAVKSGVVLAPSDKTFLITTTNFSAPCKPGIKFQIDGVLIPPDGPAAWPESDKSKWLVFYGLDRMTLTGNGTIEGKGEKWWDLPCKPHRGGKPEPRCDKPPSPHPKPPSEPCNSPSTIQFILSTNLKVSDLTIQNSPEFHVIFDECEGVMVESLTLSSPKLSPNTDGIHLAGSKSVGIYNSSISNGDDCISIVSGCSDVYIHGVTCGHSHGISIGSLGRNNTAAFVSNIIVHNVTISDADNGLRIKTWQGGKGSVSGISYYDVKMENVRNSIVIDQYYGLLETCKNETSAVYVTNIDYRKIKGTYDVRTAPVRFACSDTVPCTNITVSDIELLPHEGNLTVDPFCWNAYGTNETETIPPSCLKEGIPEAIA